MLPAASRAPVGVRDHKPDCPALPCREGKAPTRGKREGAHITHDSCHSGGAKRCLNRPEVVFPPPRINKKTSPDEFIGCFAGTDKETVKEPRGWTRRYADPDDHPCAPPVRIIVPERIRGDHSGQQAGELSCVRGNDPVVDCARCEAAAGKSRIDGSDTEGWYALPAWLMD